MLSKKPDIMNKRKTLFIYKLYTLLQSSNYENNNIIHWNDKGNSFIISNMNKFCNVIMPKVFNLERYSSFQRNLNAYGFTKIYNKLNETEFYHPDFFRNNLDFLWKIRRKKTKKAIYFMDNLRIIKQDYENLSSDINKMEEKLNLLDMNKVKYNTDNLILKQKLKNILERQNDYQNLILYLIEFMVPEFSEVRNFLMRKSINNINEIDVEKINNYFLEHMTNKMIGAYNKESNNDNNVRVYDNFMEVD